MDCINYYLLFAFEKYTQQHFSWCQECDKMFDMFKILTNQLDATYYPKIIEYQK